jgi:hypothetical protein
MVATALVLKVLKQIWAQKHEKARRLRARIEAVLDWAKAHHYREGQNPAAGKVYLDQILDKTSNICNRRAITGRPRPTDPLCATRSSAEVGHHRKVI